MSCSCHISAPCSSCENSFECAGCNKICRREEDGLTYNRADDPVCDGCIMKDEVTGYFPDNDDHGDSSNFNVNSDMEISPVGWIVYE